MSEPTLDDVMAKLEHLGKTALAVKAERDRYEWALIRVLENTASFDDRKDDLRWLGAAIVLCRAFAQSALRQEPVQ